MSASIHHSYLDDVGFDYENATLATPEQTAEFLNDEGPHKTVWMVYDRQFPDGQRELCAVKTTRMFQNGPLAMPNRARRGESESREENRHDSIKRAKQAVRLRCKSIGADRMLTLTYRQNMQCKETVAKHWKAFVRRMSKLKQFHYIAVVVRQQRGAFHLHVAVKGYQFYQLIRQFWQEIVGVDSEGRQMGQINVRNPNKFGFSAHKMAAYIAKYIGKDMDDQELNKKKYWSSRGIVIPEKNYYQLPYGTESFDAFAHVMTIAADHNNQGMVYFSNDRLGVCWVATGPVLRPS